MAVVKSNGYGHGAVQVARASLNAGASWCGVARAEEAFELRHAGLDCSILLLGYTPKMQLDEAIAREISLTIWNIVQLNQAAQAVERVGKPARVHLKIDTGMSRVGVQPEEAIHIARAIASHPAIHFEGIFTHFAIADEPDQQVSAGQEFRFREVLHSLAVEGIRPQLIHAANSATALFRPSAYFDMVRAGISLYGLNPSTQCSLPPAFRAALTWKAVLSQVKVLPPGRGISYGHTYTTQAHERIGTVPAGYADGLRRTIGNQVLIRGKRVPVIGRVCMDQVMVQLDSVPEAQEGDEVVLIGEQGEEAITAEEIAQRWGTINYEVVCGIGGRVPRIYKK